MEESVLEVNGQYAIFLEPRANLYVSRMKKYLWALFVISDLLKFKKCISRKRNFLNFKR